MVKTEFYSDIDLKENKIHNFIVDTVDVDPTTIVSTKQGRMVSYQGRIFVAKTATTGGYNYVELAQGGDLSNIISRIEALENLLNGDY